MMRLDDRTAIVTGTARGIGAAILRRFAENGATVFAHARTETPEFLEKLEVLRRDTGADIRPLCFDLTDSDAMKLKIKEIMSSKLKIDILVNNAGITYNALFHMSQESELRRQFEVNFFSLFIFTQYISKLMVRNGKGSIINIASTAAFDGNLGKSVYGASKAAVAAMTKSIAAELGEKGIRANCIAPGITETDMLATMPNEAVNESIARSDLGRSGTPEEIADVALFLASDFSSYITGQTIRADGGLV